MKPLHILLIVLTGATAGSACAQTNSADSTGLPGDNFSLEGALDLFKKSESPEEFEKNLNSEENKVNNLDLNEDGVTDYVKVIDKTENNAHAFVLQAAVSETENQDIAVIELEKPNDDQAVVQIVGDEDIYGEQKIVEPVAQGNTSSSTVTVVNVWAWPAVRYVYGPAYRVWISPWRWTVRPVWWRPWRPLRYHAFYRYRAPYFHHYGVVHTHRVVHAHRVYTPVRTTSVTVRTRNHVTVERYRTTKAVRRQTVAAPSGDKQLRTRKTTVQGGNKKRTKTVKKKKN